MKLHRDAEVIAFERGREALGQSESWSRSRIRKTGKEVSLRKKKPSKCVTFELTQKLLN